MADRWFYLLSHDYRFRGNDADLALAECLALTGGVQEETRIVSSGDCTDISRAAFTAVGAEEIARAGTLDELVDRIAGVDLHVPDFHIEIVKIPKSLPEGSLEIQERVGRVLPGRPDLVHPKSRLIVVRTEAAFRFGRIASEADTNWRKTPKLPETYSRSIPDRVARAMVNLVASPGDRILDPCCGAGTIPIQALQIGIAADASDVNLKMVGATNINLSACGYPAGAKIQDVRSCEGRWDAVVTDLPYGWFGHEKEAKDCEAILKRVMALAPKIAVATASIEHGALMGEAFARVESVPLPVSKKGTRYIHVGRM